MRVNEVISAAINLRAVGASVSVSNFDLGSILDLVFVGVL